VDECAYLPTPLSWDDPGGDRIGVFVSRRRAPSGTTLGQLWLVQGGPGGSGDVFAYFGYIDEIGALLPDVDVFVMEHRGVGESGRLWCPEQEDPNSPGGEFIEVDEIPACAAFIAGKLGPGGFEEFSATAAARDLDWVTRITAEPGVPTYLYGVSYGTYVVQRYAQLVPEGAQGLILDSVVSPGHLSFDVFDAQFDAVAQGMADRCAADATCRSKLGNDPWATLQTTVAALEADSCGDLPLPGDFAGTFFASLVADLDGREAVLPLLYRLARCDAADVAAFEHFLNRVVEPDPPIDPDAVFRGSAVLGHNIAVSELWNHAVTPDEVVSACDALVLCPGAGPSRLPWVAAWPRYDEPLAGMFATTSMPILALNGDLDPQTPAPQARLIAETFTEPTQHYVEIPDAPHAIVSTSPVADPEAPTCGLQLLAGFVDDPTAPLRDACLEDLVRLEVAGTPARAMDLFGVPDFWENQSAAPAPTGRYRHLTRAQWRRILRRFARRRPFPGPS
jgi:pimeloyl-ACP methyl ester carboxylesterase